MRKIRTMVYTFLAGLGLGLAAYHGALLVAGLIPVNRNLIEELEVENQELTDELFRTRPAASVAFNPAEMPYDERADAATMVEIARNEALADEKFLMVTFGANWCLDCRRLHQYLNDELVTAYTRELFQFINVDVGKFNKNRELAEYLGVSLTRGIPAAVFFNPEGKLIGATNEGQLEPSRYYSSAQILKFVRDIVERDHIAAPDSVD